MFRLRKVYNVIEKKVFHGFALRLIIEGYFEIAVTAFMNVKSVKNLYITIIGKLGK